MHGSFLPLPRPLAAPAALGLLLAATACGGGAPPGTSAPGELRGPRLEQAIPKPDFTLQTLDGEPFQLREATDGHLTLLFFGYTHCPDICPLHMANIAAVLKKMPISETERIKVVFVTTDPERDTPERLRAWLANFHPSFIGVTGSPEALERAQRAAMLAPAFRDTTGATAPGEYLVGHAAQVLAYTPDDSLRAMYPWGIRQEDWANDLPLLLRKWPGR